MNDNALQNKATLLLAVGVVYMINIGVLYVWSIIRRTLESDWGWTATQSGLPFSIAIVCFATGNLIGGRLQVKIPARIIGTLGGLMVGGGFILSGLAGDSPAMVALFFGLITGVGVGFGYCSFLPTALKWYHPTRKGFVSGWIIGGFGLTSLHFAPLTSMFINNFGIQSTFIILGTMTIIISVPLAQFIKNPPDGYIPAEPKNISQRASSGFSADKTWKEMVSTKKFYMLFFMFLCSVSIGQMVIANISGIVTLQANITDPSVLAALVAFMAVVNTGGRIIGGIVSDRIGWANTLIIVFALHFFNMLGFGFYNSLATLIVGITFAGMCFGATLSVYPAITVDQYGLKNYSSNYGVMYMAFGFAGIAAPAIASHFFDLDGNFNTVYIICAVGMVLMMLTNLLVRKVIKSEK